MEENHNHKGTYNPNWKGGYTLSSDGYVMIYMPGHLKANSRNYVREHVVIAEKVFGKPLPKEVVIHHHGEKTDQTQLVVCQDQAYHMLLHQRMRALKVCGHATWRKCNICKEYDNPEKLYINGCTIYHKKCYNEYRRGVQNNEC